VAHRAATAALALTALVILPARPLVSLVFFGAAIAVFANGRGAFGYGMSRAVLAFITALFLGVLGVVTSLLGLVSTDPGGNYLLLPGLFMLGLALALLAWAVVTLLRIRRHGGFWADG
jgi:ascorbate-specific PTS system EIIC-type component UlaA